MLSRPLRQPPCAALTSRPLSLSSPPSLCSQPTASEHGFSSFHLPTWIRAQGLPPSPGNWLFPKRMVHRLTLTPAGTDPCLCSSLAYCWVSLVAQLVKNLPAMRETWVRSLGWEDHLEKATHSSILAWRIPWTVQSMGSQRARLD